jgi:phospholipid/cholesterol/gamma-HCH transport system substrate-binding protein
METRANHVWVGAVTLLLLALLAAFFVWLVQLGGADTKEYDIFFPQSVGGLAEGSEVTFQGVNAGQVETIELWRQDPSFVRVRVELNEEIPILQGTTASISASFTGLSTVSLGGAVKGAPPITEPGPEGVPVIPATPGGLGEILASAPLLLERIATLTDRLTRLLSDENQASITGILKNTDRMSAQFADMGPEMRATLTQLKGTLAQSTETLDAFETTLRSTDTLLNKEGTSLAQELRTTLRSAQQAASAMEATMQDVRPAAREMSTVTLPAANAAIQDLRRTSESLRVLTEKIESQGAGSLIGGGKLPDYQP